MSRDRLEAQLAALAAMSSAELRAEWRSVHRAPAPEVGNDLLRRGIAYRLQERAHGGLSSDAARRLARAVKQLGGNGVAGLVPELTLKPGTRLVREWHGKAHQVLVREDGYLYEDRHYASLSRIARDITGVSWSGPRFFGLARRAKAAAGAADG